MHSKNTLLSIFLVAIVLIFGISSVVLGQQDMCPILVERALTEVGNNCAGLGRNAACYGFNRVDTTFFEAMDEGFFSTPADRAELPLIQTLQTAPLSVDQSEWGVAVMNVQANLPGTLPGQGVMFLLMGDVAIENEVAPLAVPTFEPVRMLTLENMNLRTRPTANSNILANVPVGTEMLTDGIDSDGEWLRVIHNNTVAWVWGRYVTVDADLASLPIVDNPPPTAMQAIRLRTGITGVSCEETPPSALVIQSPQHLVVDISVNGVEMRIGSTVFYRNVEIDAQSMMQIGVIDGSIVFQDGTTMPTGFTGFVPLNEDGTASGPITNLRPMNSGELAEMQPLQNFPAGLLSYTIDVPTEEEVAYITSLVGATPEPPPIIVAPQPTPAPVVVMQMTANEAPAETPQTLPIAETTMVPTVITAASTPEITGLALNVSAPCVATATSDRIYVISNPNTVPVGYSYTVSSSGVSGSGSLNGGESLTVTSVRNGNNIINVNWGYGSGTADSNPCA
jgi:Bacterial SH3 domain